MFGLPMMMKGAAAGPAVDFPVTLGGCLGCFVAKPAYVTQSAGRVSQWTDLAGIGNMVQPTDLNQPLFGTHGGVPVVEIDDADRAMSWSPANVKHMFYVQTLAESSTSVRQWTNSSTSPRVNSLLLSIAGFSARHNGAAASSGDAYATFSGWGVNEFIVNSGTASRANWGNPGSSLRQKTAAVVWFSSTKTGADLSALYAWSNHHFGTSAVVP